MFLTQAEIRIQTLLYICCMILVTGGTGFVGSHLLYRLVSKGKNVRAIKRSCSSKEMVQQVFKRHHAEEMLSAIEWVEADVLDQFALLDAMEAVKQVYHTAATVSFEPTGKSLMMQTNVTGTANVVNAALEKKIDKLCFVSSIAALGRTSGNKPVDEQTHFSSSVKPSAYSVSKFEAEREVWRGIHEGLNAVIVNPSIILGAGNWNEGSSKLFQTVYHGLKFYTTGSNGFVDVDDVSKAMILLMESDITNERFIISSENIRYQQLFTWMATSLGVPVPQKKAGALLSAVYWRALKVQSLLTGKAAVVTKETARTAQQHYRYNNSKFLKQFDFEYLPVQKSIEQAAKLFLQEKS